MPTKAEIEQLSPDLKDGWNALGMGFQSTIHNQLEQLRKNSQFVPLEYFLNMWAFQTPPGELIARGAGTGVTFEPTGLCGPRLFRLQANQGMDPTNLVLVCQAYWRLRIMSRTFGQPGHDLVKRWLDAVELDGLTPTG